MAIVLDVRLSVNSWNAVKFVLFEILISIFFARLWESFVRNRTYRIIRNGHVAKLFTSGLGRLSPAQLMVCHSRGAGTPRLSRFAPSKVILLLVNAVLLMSLLLAEYGSTSTPVFQEQMANVTTLARHEDLVLSLLEKERNVTELYPMKLSPGDYTYDSARSRIELGARIRNSSSNKFLRTKSPKPKTAVKLCGMLTHPCEIPTEQAKLAKLPRVYEVEDGQILKNIFLNPNAIPNEVFVSTSVRQIGWLNATSGRYIGLGKATAMENISCAFRDFFFRRNISSCQLLLCAMESGTFIHFLSFEKPQEKSYEQLYTARPRLRDRAGVLYSISKLFENSLFGVEKRFVPSRTVAIWQILHYPNILRSLRDIDLTLVQVLKEQNLWAILGMVSGNSAIEQVILETKAVNAAVNALFIIGFSMILLICSILITFNCAERCRGKPAFHVPVADGELLGQIRQLGDLRRDSGVEKLKSLEFRKRRSEDDVEYLSFHRHPSDQCSTILQ